MRLRLVAYELTALEWETDAVPLACCCKSFEDPALDAIWETVAKNFPGRRLGKGLRCECPNGLRYLPPHLFHSEVFQKGTNNVRVNSFSQVYPKGAEIVAPGARSPDVFLGLQHPSDNEPFLPNLKNLYLWPIAAEFTRKRMCCKLRQRRRESKLRDLATLVDVSEFVLTANQSALRTLDADFLLTEEARGVVHNLPN